MPFAPLGADQCGCVAKSIGILLDAVRTGLIVAGVLRLRPTKRGTPSVTTQGMREPEMATIAALIARALRARDDHAELEVVRKEVGGLCERFPPYPDGPF